MLPICCPASGSVRAAQVAPRMIPLPIDDVLPAVADAMAVGTAAVLVAPPGAGKTTRVPLALLDAPWAEGRRMVLLEPRRLAARAAAERMAATLDGGTGGEPLGGTVGLRARFDTHPHRGGDRGRVHPHGAGRP